LSEVIPGERVRTQFYAGVSEGVEKFTKGKEGKWVLAEAIL